MSIKRILGGKSKNLCDVAYLLTLPFDKNFERYGFGEVEINVEPNTAYTLSRENSDLINLGYVTYFGLANEHDNPTPDDAHHKWLNHQTIPSRCRKSVTLTSNSDGKLWVFFSGSVYNCWQKNLNPFGYIQLELGSTATEYVPYELTSYKSIMKVNDVCQLLDKSKYRVDATDQGITFTNNGDGSWTVVGTAPDDPTNHSYVEYSILILDKAFTTKHFIPGHKIIVGGGKVENVAWVQWILSWSGGYIAANSSNINSYTITEYPENFTGNFICLRVQKGQTVNFTFKPQLFDLTEMFGAGNEPKTVDEFKAKFPNDYYPYSPSCFVTSYDERMPCKTKNLFDINANSEKGYYDEQGKFYPNPRFLCFTIDVLSNNTYCISTSKLGSVKGIVSFWNNNTFVSAVNYSEHTAFAYTVPSGANKLKFVIEANQKYSNIQIELGSTATDYVPYGYV